MALKFKGNFIKSVNRFCFQSNPEISRFHLTRQLTEKSKFQVKYLPRWRPYLSVSVVKYLKMPIFTSLKLCHYSNSNKDVPKNLESLVLYEKVSEETMESLVDRFEEILQDSNVLDWDVNYSNDVLTVVIEENCTYVINKQTPNRQIWLSSPISGPKRYDFIEGHWIYKHDGMSLHELLSKELTEKLQIEANFMNCRFSS